MDGHKVPLVIHVTPANLQIDRQALTVLRGVLGQPAPLEGCALLLGCRLPHSGAGAVDRAGPLPGPTLRLQRIWPCLNVWDPPEERRRRFRIDPREQLLAQKWGRGRGLEVLGSAHSHPAGAPTPSATDLSLTLGPTLMLILAGEPAVDRQAPPELGCWWLSEPHTPEAQFSDPQTGGATAQPLMWRMED
jgi:proteasome lid subunit RPN8/RPN11